MFYFFRKERAEKEYDLFQQLLSILDEKNIAEQGLDFELVKSRFLKFQKSHEHKTEFMERSLKSAERELERIIRELDEAKIDIKEAETSKGIFLANVSHELRTPLNAILGYSQILQRDSEWFSEVHRNGINIIQKSGTHLLSIINEILDFTKLDAHKTELVTSPFNLVQTINQVVAMMEVRAREKGLDFQQDISKEIPQFLSGDEQKLKQILINLLGNAIKFTDSGMVSIVIRREAEDNYFFSVQDSGVGIDSTEQKNIFEAFYQTTGNGNKSKQSGTGLGLAISKRLVELLGGELTVVSQLGNGSSFSFSISLPENKETAKNLSKKSKIDGYEGEKREILILGNDPESRFLIQDTLRRLDFSVLEVQSTEEAMNKINSDRPDLIIIDFKKPFESYLDFVKRIKIMESELQRGYDPNLESFPQAMRILATSVSVLKEDQERMLASGCDSFLCKPFSNVDLCEEIERLLQIKWTVNYKNKIQNTDSMLNNQRSYLDQNLYDQFNFFALKGDIKGIKNLAEEISHQRQDYQQFTKKVLHLSSQFQINAIRELLCQYAPGNMKDSDIKS